MYTLINSSKIVTFSIDIHVSFEVTDRKVPLYIFSVVIEHHIDQERQNRQSS